MKHFIAALLCCLLLCGCGAEQPPEAADSSTEPSTFATAPEGLYDAGSVLEQKYGGGVRSYPLNLSDARGMIPFGDGLLIFTGDETTNLILLTGENLYPEASTGLDFFLDSRDPSLVVGGSALSYYDPVTRETVVLDTGLKIVSRITAPEGLIGKPVLTQDRNLLYYCTETSLRVWDLESGIRRTIKEMAYPGQTVAGLHWGETIVHCQTDAGNLFLSAADGHLVQEYDGAITLVSTDSTFSAAVTLGLNPMLVYRCAGASQLLLPETLDGEYYCLSGGLGAVRVWTPSENQVELEYYDLTSGLRSSVLRLDTTYHPDAAARLGDFVYILTFDDTYGCSTVYRWDIAALATNDAAIYAGAYAGEDASLREELALCRQYAQELGARYGIEILVGPEAAATEPWDYYLEAELQPALIERELELLEQRLANYPGTILADTAADFTSLKLCLVRSITGSAESGSLDAATGVQFLEGTDAYVVIAGGQYAQQALYHELFHAMETHILNNSIAFDQWEKLNPAGFDYDYSTSATEARDAGIYLQPEHRAFIDRYSMTFPREDRARILEYAMLDGNRQLFEAPILQSKLQAICDGIREAYGLKKSEERFLWEQYLQ